MSAAAATVQDFTPELTSKIMAWASGGVDGSAIRKLVMLELKVEFLVKEVKAKVTDSDCFDDFAAHVYYIHHTHIQWNVC
jgi:hypothetical protein